MPSPIHRPSTLNTLLVPADTVKAWFSPDTARECKSRVNAAMGLLSYGLPVALREGGDTVIPEGATKISRTTAKHIREWTRGGTFTVVPEHVFCASWQRAFPQPD